MHHSSDELRAWEAVPRPSEATIEEIAAGLAELGTGGTPAFIRGYNRGYDDAFEHAKAEAVQPDPGVQLTEHELTRDCGCEPTVVGVDPTLGSVDPGEQISVRRVGLASLLRRVDPGGYWSRDLGIAYKPGTDEMVEVEDVKERSGEVGNAGQCPKCDRWNPDGPDICLGRIPGVTAACCGHGFQTPYVAFGVSAFDYDPDGVTTLVMYGPRAEEFFAHRAAKPDEPFAIDQPARRRA
jgi:hypothetical protein